MSVPLKTPGGLPIVAFVMHTPNKNYNFVIAESGQAVTMFNITGDMQPDYVVERIKSNYQPAKRTPEALWGRVFNRISEASDAIDAWDNGSL